MERLRKTVEYKERARRNKSVDVMMALRAALLKSIWYAFTSLDTEDSGKVSKSQLKVRDKTDGLRQRERDVEMFDADVCFNTVNKRCVSCCSG